MRCASRVARFYSLGLVSGGLREQAASFLRPSSVLRSVSMYCPGLEPPGIEQTRRVV